MNLKSLLLGAAIACIATATLNVQMQPITSITSPVDHQIVAQSDVPSVTLSLPVIVGPSEAEASMYCNYYASSNGQCTLCGAVCAMFLWMEISDASDGF